MLFADPSIFPPLSPSLHSNLIPPFRFIITYERELIAEPEEDIEPSRLPPSAAAISRDKKQSVVSALTNPSGIFSIDTAKSQGTLSTLLPRERDSDLDVRPSHETPSGPDVVGLNELQKNKRTPLCVMNALLYHMKTEVRMAFIFILRDLMHVNLLDLSADL